MRGLRNHDLSVRLRRAHAAGTPILLIIETAALTITVAVFAWTATSTWSGAVAIAIAVASVVSVLLIAVGSMAVPDDAPKAPSWFTAQRQARTIARNQAMPNPSHNRSQESDQMT